MFAHGKHTINRNAPDGAVEKPLRWVFLDIFGSGLRAGFAVLLRQNRRIAVFLPGACPCKNISWKNRNAPDVQTSGAAFILFYLFQLLSS